MSALQQAVEKLEVEISKLSEKRFVNTMEAALLSDRHPETVREAARAGELHGSQRGGLNPRTGKPRRGGEWRFRPACVDAWTDGVPCEHQQPQKAISLDEYRMRAVGGRR